MVSLECPPENPPAAPAHSHAQALVSCLVPLVWPAQRPFLDAVLRTYGPDCDELHFFAALADGAPAAPRVVDLRADFPWVPPDRDDFHRETAVRPAHGSSNTIVKLLHMLRWAADRHLEQKAPFGVNSTGNWWYCRLERDTLFIPENFRLLIALAGLDASAPHYLGTREFADAPRSGLAFNDGGPGVCLSAAALLRLAAVLARAPALAEGQGPDFERCAWAEGHREDLMLAACLREAGILSSPAGTDARGREWFSIRPLRAVAAHRPPSRRRPDSAEAAEAARHSWNFWAGRAHLYLPCLEENDFWVVDTPCSFNSFKNVSMFDDAWALLALPEAERRAQLGGYAARRSGLVRGARH